VIVVLAEAPQLAIVNCRGTHSDLSRASSGRIQNCHILVY